MWAQISSAQRIGELWLSDSERANQYFEDYSYVKAIEYYKLALEKEHNQQWELNIAESYHKINQPQKAVQWYQKALKKHPQVDPHYKLHYAQVLSKVGDYDKARDWYEAYHQDYASERRVNNKLRGIAVLDDFRSTPDNYSIEILPINSTQSDFAPAYMQDHLVFVSSRSRKGPESHFYSWNEQAFLDLYHAGLSEDGRFSTPRRFNKKINSKFHEGPAVFYGNGNKMIFTRSNYDKGKLGKGEDDVVHLKLFYTERKNSESSWSKVRPLSINSEEYSVGHPALTQNGKTLFFASDMPGGYGGTDLYKSEFSNGEWGEPVNLGPDINTEGNEMFPFLYDDQMLYFASDGFGGLGGLDIYRTDLTRQQTRVFNLGSPINSSQDDFALILESHGGSGYFSSNRDQGVGDDDIYSFLVHSVQVQAALLSKNKKYLQEADLKVKDAQTGKYIPFFRNGETLEFEGIPGREYLISAEGPYNETEVSVLIDPLPYYVRQADLSVEIEGLKTGPLSVVAESEAPIRLIILDNNSQQDQLILASAQEMILYEHSQLDSLHRELDLIGKEIKETITIKNIQYNFDRSFIRKDAREDMQELSEILMQYPKLSVRLKSHTDSRASFAYNKKLSQQRAEAAKAYLMELGVNPERISAESYGESQLVNECADGVHCPEELHQENRRTEFFMEEN